MPADLLAATQDPNPYSRLGAVTELRSRLVSENVAVAAGARGALVTLASTDTRLVADAASAALAELVLGMRPASLSFGQASDRAATGSLRVELTGPALARHVEVKASHPWIRVHEVEGGYDISVSSAASATSGTVTFSGPGGDAVLVVDVTAGERSEPGRDDSALTADDGPVVARGPQEPGHPQQPLASGTSSAPPVAGTEEPHSPSAAPVDPEKTAVVTPAARPGGATRTALSLGGRALRLVWLTPAGRPALQVLRVLHVVALVWAGFLVVVLIALERDGVATVGTLVFTVIFALAPMAVIAACFRWARRRGGRPPGDDAIPPPDERPVPGS